MSAKKKVAAAQAAEAAAEAEAARGRYNRDLEMAGEYNRSVHPAAPRTDRTRLVPPPVLTGHSSSLPPY